MTFTSEFVPCSRSRALETGNKRYAPDGPRGDGRRRRGGNGIKCFRVYVACVNKTFRRIFRTGINERKGMRRRRRNNKTEIYLRHERAERVPSVCIERGSLLRRVRHRRSPCPFCPSIKWSHGVSLIIYISI